MSYKTAVPRAVGISTRQYLIRTIDENVLSYELGKCPIGSNLAANIYKKFVGKPLDWLATLYQEIDVSMFFYRIRDESMINSQIGKREFGFPPARSSSLFGQN
jgi:hypothetical protein